MFKTRNPYLQALFTTILLMASIHLTILVVDAVVHQNWQLLNLFHIQNLNDFWPRISDGAASFVIASLIGVGVYIAIFLSQKPKN